KMRARARCRKAPKFQTPTIANNGLGPARVSLAAAPDARVGSLIVALTSTAAASPGRPITTNATRQPSSSFNQPPTIKLNSEAIELADIYTVIARALSAGL